MALSKIFCILGCLAIAFAKVAWWAKLGRMLVGCGMGILSCVVLFVRISDAAAESGIMEELDLTLAAYTVVGSIMTIEGVVKRVGYSSPSRSGVMNDLGLTVAQYSVFGSILTTGAMIGAIVSGRIADYFGRRGAMASSDIFCILGWLAIAFSKVAWWAELGRLLVRCGMGILSYVVPIYILHSRITLKNLRGGFTTVHQLMICCGLSLTYGIGAFLNWRALAPLGTVPCVTQILGLLFVPESPRLLQKWVKGKSVKLLFQHLRGQSVAASQESGYIETPQRLSEVRFLTYFKGDTFPRCRSRAYGTATIRRVKGIVFYASTIFISADSNESMTTLGVILIDKSGRSPLLLVPLAGTCLRCLLVGLSFVLQNLQQWKQITPILSLVGVLIFPINMKGSAGSLVTLVTWLGSWINSYVLIDWNSAGNFFLFSSLSAVTILSKLVPEKKFKHQ